MNKEKNRFIKIVPLNIGDLLTTIGIAHWIMCDGTSNQYGLTLCTDGFTLTDVVILINILIIKYELDCRMHLCNNKPRIYITAKSMNRLREIVEPYIIPFSAYKLKKGK